MKPSRTISFLAAFVCVAVLALSQGVGDSQESAAEPNPGGKVGGSEKSDKSVVKPPRIADGKRPSSVPGGDPDPFRDLSPDQRDRLREAVRRAWTDPAVLQARDEVKAATDAYQNALRESLIRTDPDIANLIEKFRLSSQSDFKGYLFPAMNSGRGGSGNAAPDLPPGGGNPRDGKGIDSFLVMENPAFLRDVDEEKKRLYREAHRKAMDSPEVKSRLEALKSLRHEDDEMRKKRTEAIRGMHQSLRRALVEADPRVGEFLPKVMPDGRRSDGESGEKRGGKNEAAPQPPPPPRDPKPEK